MATITPNWSDATPVPVQTLARNAILRTTLDLRARHGAYALPLIGRQGTTALTNGVDFLVRRTVAANTITHPGAYAAFVSQAVAAISTTCAASGNDAGVGTLTVASTTSFVAGDTIMVGDPAAVGTIEWCRVARITSGTALLLDAPTRLAHNSTAHFVRNKADAFGPVWLDGGAICEVIFDYGDDTAGEAVTVACYAQLYDSNTSV